MVSKPGYFSVQQSSQSVVTTSSLVLILQSGTYFFHTGTIRRMHRLTIDETERGLMK